MSVYRVTIHEHKIYDYMVEANSKQEAEAMAEETVVNAESHFWREDEMAGWTELGDVYNEDGEEI